MTKILYYIGGWVLVQLATWGIVTLIAILAFVFLDYQPAPANYPIYYFLAALIALLAALILIKTEL